MFVFPYGALSQVWYLIVLISDLCLLTYFDIKFTSKALRTLVEWWGWACQAIQHVFSKPTLVNMISKDANLVFYVSVYKLVHSSN